jgi:hypothetical protein
MATTTNRYLSYPAAQTGSTVTTSTTGFTLGSWAEIVPASTITSTFYIYGVTWQFPAALTTAATYQHIIEIGKGAAASESTIIQIPASHRNQTNVAYIKAGIITFPEAVEVAANTRIAARAANSISTTAFAFQLKIMYQTA